MVNIVNATANSTVRNLQGGQKISFVSIVKNTSNETLNNFTTNYKISEGSSIVEAGTKTNILDVAVNAENVSISENKDTATCTISTLAPGESVIFGITVSVGHQVNALSTVAYTDGSTVGRSEEK